MLDDFVYNNEEESEMGQLHAIHLNLNAVAQIRRELAKQQLGMSLSHCADCGDDIPQKRQQLIPGVRLCFYCQQLKENG